MYLALMFASTKLLCLCLYIVLYSKYHSMFLLFLFFFFFFFCLLILAVNFSPLESQKTSFLFLLHIICILCAVSYY